MRENPCPQRAALLALNCLLVSILLLPCLPSMALAQESSLSSVRDSISHNRLTLAIRQARNLAASNPQDPQVQETLGILLLADGKIMEAGQAFAAALRIDPQRPRTPTGLEGLATRGSALYLALARQKVTISLNGGAAADRNNLGAVKLILNKADDAMKDLDEAVRLRPEWGAPWANSAIAWLAKNKPQRAEDAGHAAMDRGEASAKVFTSLAESQYQLEKWDEAEAYLKQAQEADADFPYALFVRAQLLKKTMRPRESERALIQSVAMGSGVASELRQVPTHNDLKLVGGTQTEDHQNVLSDGQPSGTSYRLLLEKDDRQVENRDGAYQQRRFSQFVLGLPKRRNDIAIYASFLNEAGGLPGADTNFQPPNDFGITSQPTGSFGFNRTSLGVVGRTGIGKRGELLYHLGYRHNGVSISMNSSFQESTSPLRDEQLVMETRMNQPLGSRRTIQAGISFLDSRREMAHIIESGGGDFIKFPTQYTPVEPNEQTLPDGYSGIWRFYAFDRRQLSSRMSLDYGPTAVLNNGAAFLLPYLDARYRLTPRRTLRFSILSRAMDAVSDLYPLGALPDGTPGSPEDQNGYTTRTNREPLIEGVNGRETSYELGWLQTGRRGRLLSITGFYRHYSDVLNRLDDPSLTFVQTLDPIDRAEATGVEFRIAQPFGPLTVELYSRIQSSHATSQPGTVANQVGHLAYMPDQQTRLRVSAPVLGGWHVSAEAVHTPAQHSLDTVLDPPVLTTIPGSVSINLMVRHRVSNGMSLFLNSYGLFGSRYSYDHYSAPRSTLGGISLRF